MAKGIFLVAPELNAADVSVTASSELGRRAGGAIAFDSNSGLLKITTIGDAGDDLSHDVRILGSQDRPWYSPLTLAGARRFTDPTTFGTVGTITLAASHILEVVAGDDRLWAVIYSSGTLYVYVWNGSAWTLKTSLSGLTNAGGGIAATSIKENIYIAVANNTDSVVELYRYNATSNTIGIAAEAFISTNGDLQAISIASNGAIFVVAASVLTASLVNDVEIYFGSVGSMEQNDSSVNDIFSATWATGNDVRAGCIKYSSGHGFVLAVRCGTGSPAKLRLAKSANGSDWQEIAGLGGVATQPTTTTPWASNVRCAIAVENRRIFVYRGTAASQDSAATDVKMQWMDGGRTWSAEVDADGGVAIAAGVQLSAANWRGRMHFGWRNSGTQSTIRKNNDLTTTNTGYYRELIFGQPMFIAGIEDDTKTRLAFVATGSITAGDTFRIKGTEYDYRVGHVLDDFLSKVWRGNDAAEQTIDFDAGSGRGFVIDAIAIFGANFPSITVKMDSSPTFSTPPVSQAISGTVATATAVSASLNRVKFAAGTFEDQQFNGGVARFWMKAGSSIFRILGNTSDTLIVDGDATGISTSVTIFRDCMGYLFSSQQGPYRYLRLTTPNVTTPDGYVEIKRVLFGLMFAPPVDYRVEWIRRYGQQQGRLELKSGARFNTLLNVMQRPAWSLTFRRYEEDVRPIQNFFGRAQGGVRLFGFWPNPSALIGDQPEVFPMFFTTDPPEHRNVPPDAAEVSIVIEGQL